MTAPALLLDALWREQRSLSRYEALLDLLRLASPRPKAVPTAEGRVALERGELVTSGRQLAQRWGWGETTVRRFIAELVAAGELLVAKIPGLKGGMWRRLTLVHYETYAKRWRSILGDVAQSAAQPKSPNPSDLRDGAAQSAAHQIPPHPPNPCSSGLVPSPQPPQGGPGGTGDALPRVENRGAGVESALGRPEHLHYAEVLADTLNAAQLANGVVDQDTYRPVRPHHPGTLEAALAIRNAGISLDEARQYVWTQGVTYKPTVRNPQIASLAYLRRGCIEACTGVKALATTPPASTRTESPRGTYTPPERRPPKRGPSQLTPIGDLLGQHASRKAGGMR